MVETGKVQTLPVLNITSERDFAGKTDSVRKIPDLCQVAPTLEYSHESQGCNIAVRIRCGATSSKIVSS